MGHLNLVSIKKWNLFYLVLFYCLFFILFPRFINSAEAKDSFDKIVTEKTLKPIDSVVNKQPEWWGNKLGMDEIILPGYSEIITSEENKILLSDRIYSWGKNFFPDEITSIGETLVNQMRLVIKVKNRDFPLIPKKVSVERASSGAYVIVRAFGEPVPGLIVNVETRVEYDGVAISQINLNPSTSIKIDGLFYEVDIAKKPSTQIISFKAEQIRRQKDRQDFIKPPYKGDFINAIGVSDGDRSFWWFADNAEGWIWNSDFVTEITASKSIVKIRQNLIGDKWTINKPMSFKFNFMATPVRKLGTVWRSKNPLIGIPSKQEAALSGLLKLWWTTAFAHDAFPYSYYPDSVKSSIPKEDLLVFPGRSKNAQLIKRDRLKRNSFWLPYFSAHVLSRLDPQLTKFKKYWEVQPPKIFNEVVGPFKKVYGKPVLTHRAPQYSNYILWRLNDEIESLGLDGIYLDHGPPINSCNPLNGGWVDSNGKLQSSLDILALRNFLKRLRVLFFINGKPGFVFIHNSNREIIPAYSFAYAMVNGEQYRSGRVKNGEYLNALSLGEIRARFSPDQYGVIAIWLPSEWNYHLKEPGWEGSDSQRTTYRRIMSLALLHDVLLWPKGSHDKERKKLMKVLQDFGVEKAKFIGYWNFRMVNSNSPNIKVSAYYRPDTKKYLLISANTSKEDIASLLSFDISSLFPGEKKVKVFSEDTGSFEIGEKNSQLPISIPKMDFRWLKISIVDAKQSL